MQEQRTDDYRPSTYGDRIAAVYDEVWSPATGVYEGRTLGDETEATVELLAALADGGPVLELGVGTGRVAVPLAERGLEVHGIDASEAMLEQLRDKPGGDLVTTSLGDLADVDVDGAFAVVFVVFSTFSALLTQEDQIRCFANVAAHLTDTGVFVLDLFVPDPVRFERGQLLETMAITADEATLGATVHDPVAQRVDSQHIHLREDGIKLYPVYLRYVWPSELDLMARLAGLRLRDRFADWRGAPFTAASTRHVSIYARSDAS